jgi:hypothetical protein
MELCAHNYDPSFAAIMTSKSKHEIFVVTTKAIATMLDSPLGSMALSLEEHWCIYLSLTDGQNKDIIARVLRKASPSASKTPPY